MEQGRSIVLADTSVWIDHFRSGNQVLERLLEDDDVVMHPFVLGELACGNLANRAEVIDLLRRLPRAQQATDDEVLEMIERSGLMGRGIGYVDTHLLAAAALTPFVRLWTLDLRLARAASELSLR